jgi:hypothetical protein
VSDLIDAYLDRLLRDLRGAPGEVRRFLSEAEEHLHDATATGVKEGLSVQDAQRRAIERFGSPRLVARRFSRSVAPLPRGAVLAALARTLAGLGAVGLIAIGVSGLLAEAFGRLFGYGFVAGDLPGVTYTPQRCAEYLEYFPKLRSCAEAATLHHFGEIVEYRVAAGVLGLLLLGCYLLLRRHDHDAQLALPNGFSATIGTALFGLAGGVLLLESLNSVVIGARTGSAAPGAGGWLSAALVALAVAVVYARSFYRSVLAT